MQHIQNPAILQTTSLVSLITVIIVVVPGVKVPPVRGLSASHEDCTVQLLPLHGRVCKMCNSVFLAVLG